MTISAADLAFYAAALLVLFLTPGPVWVALMARAVSGGWAAAWPLALGVVVGDALWPFLALLGMGWVVSGMDGLMWALRLVAAGVFVWMGRSLWVDAGAGLMAADGRLARPGARAGFVAGLAAILGNPKAILFYMGVLPGFFDPGRLSWPDMAAIVAVSMAIPLCGNLLMAAFLGRLRWLLSSPRTLARMNRAAGLLLIGVGVAIPFV